MMVAIVRIWPNGSESNRFEIGRMVLGDESNLSEIGDYTVHVAQKASRALRVGAINTNVQIVGHYRREGSWAWVRRVPDRLEAAF